MITSESLVRIRGARAYDLHTRPRQFDYVRIDVDAWRFARSVTDDTYLSPDVISGLEFFVVLYDFMRLKLARVVTWRRKAGADLNNPVSRKTFFTTWRIATLIGDRTITVDHFPRESRTIKFTIRPTRRARRVKHLAPLGLTPRLFLTFSDRDSVIKAQLRLIISSEFRQFRCFI